MFLPLPRYRLPLWLLITNHTHVPFTFPGLPSVPLLIQTLLNLFTKLVKYYVPSLQPLFVDLVDPLQLIIEL